jgi:ribosomal protein S27AE
VDGTGAIAAVSGPDGYIARMGTLFTVIGIFVGVFVWLGLAMLAGVFAPDDREGTFIALTLLFGPLGILAAAVASPRDLDYFAHEPRRIAKGRTRYQCSRCGAESDLANAKNFSCWRCEETKCLVADS